MVAVRCTLFTADSVPASTATRLVVAGVVNPRANARTLQFSTSSDTKILTMKYIVTAAKAVSGLTASLSSTTPSASGVTYTVGFSTSVTGMLSNAADSRVRAVFPAGTNVNSLSAATGVFVGSTRVGSCFNESTSSPPVIEVDCELDNGDVVAAGTAATVVFAGLVNPGSGSYKLDVSTTSDVR